MRIIVNDIAASPGGGMSILKEFYRYVSDSGNANEWIFLIGGDFLEETPNIRVIPMQKVKKSWLNKLKFDLVQGKKFIRDLDPDVVFSLQNIITFGINVPQVVYIHQSIPFQKIKNFSFLKSKERVLAVYQHLIGRMIKISARKADKIIVQTEWMKKAVCDQAKVDPDKVIRIYPELREASRFENKGAFSGKSFICPTSDEVYKNNECVYRAAQLLRQRGTNDFTVKMTILSDENCPNIEFTGWIPREELFAEYRKSTLILSSYIESFPLPLEEGKRMGALILAADCEFSREILGDYSNAYFFDPFVPRELADLMDQIVTGHIKKTNAFLPKAAGNQAISSWEQVVREVVNCVCQG